MDLSNQYFHLVAYSDVISHVLGPLCQVRFYFVFDYAALDIISPGFWSGLKPGFSERNKVRIFEEV